MIHLRSMNDGDNISELIETPEYYKYGDHLKNKEKKWKRMLREQKNNGTKTRSQ